MNYRHAYHAGNFADVVKHAALTLVIERLKRKDAPFRVIDTHAGIGLYDLGSEEAQKTGEWRSGIGRLLGPDAHTPPTPVAEILGPYLDVVRSENPSGLLERYPGSPALARRLLRPQDRLVVNELQPEDAAVLAAAFAGDRQTKVMQLDGWVALKALLPPKERRGVILVDPPFEQPGEFPRLLTGLREAVKRFATGIYLLWYPIKNPLDSEVFNRDLAMHSDKLMTVELLVRTPVDISRLNGSGLAILNPPYGLREDLGAILPRLADTLAQGDGAIGRVRLSIKENPRKS